MVGAETFSQIVHLILFKTSIY